ncbi:MAG: sodium-dependent transporter [Synergistes sp.]|nr:sodium-dependent transporter [Synergistes sp.]
MEERESFASRLGFILVSAGCAIGIGNVWRFPFVTGRYGGAWFVLFYLIFLAIMGIPVMTMEFAIGRASRKTISAAYKMLNPKAKAFRFHGYIAILGNYVLMMYYTTVSGWMSAYCMKFVTGSITSGMTKDEVTSIFGNMLASPLEMGFWMALTVVLGFVVCGMGVRKGLEKTTKFMMGALLLLIIILAIHSFTLPNASEGIKFYLMPNWANIEKVGLREAMTAAMNQAFFTLSIGIATMEVLGSYMSRENTLPQEAVVVCALDTFVAVTAGLIIFPACASFGVSPDAGPSLIFITLPNVFVNMRGGIVCGVLFFLFMTFASFSTVLAVFENIISYSMDTFGKSRRAATVINCVIILIASVPCVLGYNLWSDLHIIGARDVLDSEDFLVSNLILPIGSLIFTIFCSTKYGWGFDNYLKECNSGKGIKFAKALKPYFQYVLPVLMTLLIISGLI